MKRINDCWSVNEIDWMNKGSTQWDQRDEEGRDASIDAAVNEDDIVDIPQGLLETGRITRKIWFSTGSEKAKDEIVLPKHKRH